MTEESCHPLCWITNLRLKEAVTHPAGDLAIESFDAFSLLFVSFLFLIMPEEDEDEETGENEGGEKEGGEKESAEKED